MKSASLKFPCYSKNQACLHSGNVRKEMRDSLFGKSETRSERFASSKSWNWKAGAQVHPTREKWFSPSLGDALSTFPSGEMLMSFVGKEPNHTFGGTVYCGCWLSSRLGPRQVSLTCPSFSFNSNTWKDNMLVENVRFSIRRYNMVHSNLPLYAKHVSLKHNPFSSKMKLCMFIFSDTILWRTC